MLFFLKCTRFFAQMYIWNNTYLRYYFSIVYGYSSYDDVMNDVTVTAILFSSLCIQPLSQSSEITKLPLRRSASQCQKNTLKAIANVFFYILRHESIYHKSEQITRSTLQSRARLSTEAPRSYNVLLHCCHLHMGSIT